MKVSIDELITLKEKYEDSVPLIYAKDIYFEDRLTKSDIKIFQGTTFDQSHYEILSRNNIKEVDIVFSELLLAKLSSNFPDKYRPPTYIKSFIDFDRYISAIDDANRLSKRKRFVLSATEIVSKNQIVLRYNEDITFEKWNKLKTYIDKKAEIPFYSSERGIMIVTLTNANDSNYLQKFFLHSEAVALFVEKVNKLNFVIAPDLNTQTDIFTATKEEEVLEKYMKTNIRLIVIVDKVIDEKYKNMIVKLRTYDRFVRLSGITELSPVNEIDVLKVVKKSYLSEPYMELK
ncbi:MAG: hypothetical protein RMJ37_04120 [Spirochaetia bacterium]|nr:hypothetical protein [Spirochaetota bacterium]MCX8095996.1 hypothetical protein [Spirochaetota bacterium]MDW8112513.1 hypothetical protein [Spirochaetia bacterium]